MLLIVCVIGAASSGKNEKSMKITQKPVIIEGRTLDEHREVPVMAVNLFTCPGKYQGMCRGEGCLD